MNCSTSRFISKGIAIVAMFVLAACSSEESLTGEKLFKKKCGTCHSLEKSVHKIGPSLNGVFGRKAGSTDFKKYKALKDAAFTWDIEKLNALFTNPKKYIGKPTGMTVKFKKEEERKLILNYIKSITK